MKTILSFLSLGLVLLTSTQAFAGPLVCEYKNIKLDSSQLADAKQAKAYSKKLEAECDYTRAMNRVALDLAGYKRPLNSINYYQGLRYVDRYSYEKARNSGTPLNVVFQIKKDDYNVPVAQRSHLVWNNWTAGINTIPNYKNALLSGQPFTVDMLLSIHKTFYTQDESGEYGDVTTPGKLKTPDTSEIAWPIKEKASEIKAHVNLVNQMYVDLDLQPPYVGDGFNQIIASTDSELKPSHPVYIKAHVENLARFINHIVKNVRERKPLIWNGYVFTPVEAALFAQQTVVRIHGFYDGNGRTSRYLQDLITNLFDMPFMPSGDLYADDMTLPLAEYYDTAMKANERQVQVLDSCRDNSSNFDCDPIN